MKTYYRSSIMQIHIGIQLLRKFSIPNYLHLENVYFVHNLEQDSACKVCCMDPKSKVCQPLGANMLLDDGKPCYEGFCQLVSEMFIQNSFAVWLSLLCR